MTKVYQHTQTGTVIVLLFGLILSGMVVAFVFLKSVIFLLLVFVSVFILLLFYQFTVIVDERTVQLKYGIGIIKKVISLHEIKTIAINPNLLLYGWFIWYIGGGSLYNVPGVGSVELKLVTADRIRIGTDDPRGVAEAIQVRLIKLKKSK